MMSPFPAQGKSSLPTSSTSRREASRSSTAYPTGDPTATIMTPTSSPTLSLLDAMVANMEASQQQQQQPGSLHQPGFFMGGTMPASLPIFPGTEAPQSLSLGDLLNLALEDNDDDEDLFGSSCHHHEDQSTNASGRLARQ